MAKQLTLDQQLQVQILSGLLFNKMKEGNKMNAKTRAKYYGLVKEWEMCGYVGMIKIIEKGGSVIEAVNEDGDELELYEKAKTPYITIYNKFNDKIISIPLNEIEHIELWDYDDLIIEQYLEMN